MRWLGRKIDSLTGTVLAATAGLVASQAQAFVQAYLQRLGGHLDEARLLVARIAEDPLYQSLSAEQRRPLADAAAARVDALAHAFRAIAESSDLLRPLALLRHFDPDIATAAFDIFQPSLPVHAAGATYFVAGMVLAWIVYDALKSALGRMWAAIILWAAIIGRRARPRDLRSGARRG